MTVGENIKAAREDADLTMSDLAAKVGVTPSAVHHWEAGVAKPRRRTLARVAQTLGVEPEVLLGTPPRSVTAHRATRVAEPIFEASAVLPTVDEILDYAKQQLGSALKVPPSRIQLEIRILTK